MWLRVATDDCGGVGVYSPSTDFIKLLRSLVLNGNKVSKSGNVDQLLGSQLEDTSHLLQNFAGPTKDLLGVKWSESLPASYTFYGTISLDDIPQEPGAEIVKWEAH